jgi:hypothetical protein
MLHMQLSNHKQYMNCPMHNIGCIAAIALGVIVLPIFSKAEYVHALKGLVLPRASHSSEIALTGSRCLHSTLTIAPVLFEHTMLS